MGLRVKLTDLSKKKIGAQVEGPAADPNAAKVEGKKGSTATTDEVVNGETPRAPEATPPKGAIKAGDAKLGKSSALVEMILTADKTAFVDKSGKDRAAAFGDRDLAKRVGLLLQMTPYGAPVAVILKRLQEDPQIAAKFPKLTLDDLNLLHTKFPQIVPRPNNPVDMGASFDLTREGILDLYASNYVKAYERSAQLNATIPGAVPSSQKYLRERYNPGQIPLDEANFPPLHYIIDKAGQVTRNIDRIGFFLRRTILNAPPHWTAKDIADEHNRYLDFYASMLWIGDKDTIAAAKERSRMTPERVSEYMSKFSHETGADELAERQKIFRQEILTALGEAKPTDNLYEVLSRLCDHLAAKTKQPQRQYGLSSYGYGIFSRPPGPEAALSPEDLLHYLTGDPALSSELDRLMADRHAGLDKKLAERIARTFGSRLSRTSVSEIVRTMQKLDPVYNEHLVPHLISSFPKIFGSARIETGRVEVNFLLAQTVAEAMNNMFTGATLDQVADFLRARGRSFTDVYPDFSAEDIRLLQAAFPFVPQWEKKEAGVPLRNDQRMPLESLLRFATMQLGATDAKKLQAWIFDTLAKHADSESVPPALQQEVERAFSRGMMRTLGEAVGVTPEKLSEANNRAVTGGYQTAFRQRELFEKFLFGDPAADGVDHTVLMQIFTNKDLLGLPAERASQIAEAFLAARSCDFDRLHELASNLLVGNPQADNYLTKLTNHFLGLEGVISRIERDVFANKELKASFQRFARIPLRLPMIQHVVDKYKDQQPLKGQNVLMVQHMLGQAYPQIAGYKALGMDPKDAIFVGIPYHKNDEVEQAVARSFGIDVRVPTRDMEELYRAIEKGVDDVVAKHFANKQDVLIVCDGPHARNYFKEKWLAKHPELAGKVKFTEQTAFGDRPEYREDKSMRVVSYARTELKAKKEAKFIGQAVARAVNAVLTQLGTGAEEKPVLILGFGPVGEGTAAAFHGQRSKVYVYDPYISPEREAEAKKLGYTVIKDKSQVAAGKFLMIGCSGHLSIDEEQILSSDPNAIYVSASSKLVEINMRKLRELATDDQGNIRRILAAEVNDQQTWHYWLKDGTIRTVIADGLPANFNDINSVPPEFIDMTMGLSLAAAVETVTGKDLGFSQLNQGDADELNALYDSMLDKIQREAREAAAKEKSVG